MPRKSKIKKARAPGDKPIIGRGEAKALEEILSLLQSIDIAVVFLDANLHLRRYTPAVRELFELIPSDIGRPLTDLALKFNDPDLLPDVRTVFRQITPKDREVTSKSGKTFVRRVLPYREGTAPVEGAVLTFVDISGRKAAEMELRASEYRHRIILEGIKEYGIFMLDLEGRFVTWTAGAARILGYSAEEACGHGLEMLHIPEDREAGLGEKDLIEARRNGTALVERWHVRKDGSRFWATGILSLLHAENGEPYGFVKVVRDNTDHKHAEDELRRAMLGAEAANASKDHFLANVSHELRTPLSATLLWAKLLTDQDPVDLELLKEGLAAINRSAKEQQALIEDLMDTAKIVAGKMRLESRSFDLNAAIRSLLPPIRSNAAEKRQVITEELDPEVGFIEADPRRIQQVVSNLVNNAVKFTPAGGRIGVHTRRNGDDVTIRVIDNGMGVGEAFLGRIFDRFMQVDQGSTPTSGGMGLGLAIVRELVELHHGKIRAESAGKDCGTTFVITLPLARCSSSSEEPGPKPAAPDALKRVHVLVIEDTRETRHAIETVLSGAGATVATADSVSAALKEYERRAPDVILSDIGLGGDSGHDLIGRIRRMESERSSPLVPAVALTAYADERNRRKAFESGFQDCLTKPIEPSELVARLAVLVMKA